MVLIPQPAEPLGAADVEAYVDAPRVRHTRALLGAGAEQTSADVRTWCLLASARLDAGDADGALEAASTARGMAVEDPWPHSLAARALAQQGRAPDAVAAAEQALRLQPDAWQHQALLALALNRLPAAHERCWQHAAQAVRLAPQQAAAHLTMGVVAHTGRHVSQARQAYEATLRLDPACVLAREHLAMLDLSTGRSREAMRGMQAAAQAGGRPGLPLEPVTQLVERLLGRFSWTVVLQLLVLGRLSDRLTPAAGVLALLTSALVLGVSLAGADRALLLAAVRAQPHLRLWAGCLTAAALLAAMLPLAGARTGLLAGIAVVLVLVGPFSVLRRRTSTG